MRNTLLAEFTAGTTRVSNPDRSPSFRPSPSNSCWSGAFATGSLQWIIAFYRSPSNTPDPSRFRVMQSSPRADELGPSISQGIYKTGYGRFRPNMRFPLVALVLPRRLAPVLPTTYSPSYLHLAKAQVVLEHLGSPCHTFVHCRGFAPAAPRRAGTSVLVSLSGLPLSRPVRIKGLVVHYTANSLIRCRLILGRCL